jgi:hypothetical protein
MVQSPCASLPYIGNDGTAASQSTAGFAAGSAPVGFNKYLRAHKVRGSRRAGLRPSFIREESVIAVHHSQFVVPARQSGGRGG